MWNKKLAVDFGGDFSGDLSGEYGGDLAVQHTLVWKTICMDLYAISVDFGKDALTYLAEDLARNLSEDQERDLAGYFGGEKVITLQTR